MKKLLITLALLIPLNALALVSGDFLESDNITDLQCLVDTHDVIFWMPDQTTQTSFPCTSVPISVSLMDSYMGAVAPVALTLFEVDHYAEWSDYASMATYASSSSSLNVVLPHTDDIGTWLSSEGTNFQDTLGFSMASTTQWMGSNLLMPIVGNGIGAVYGLRYWIIVLVVMGALITFAFRAFRFYKH